MKRSEINEILGHTRQFFSMHDVHLPPFASFAPSQWRQLDAAWSEVIRSQARLGCYRVRRDRFCRSGTDAVYPAQRLAQRYAL
ncbi:ABC-type sugar transport system, auxiliary component [Citrobacter koseri]|nr:ABC-type sugar transport system, auxiliary component [Citrobacter koseri]